MKACAALLDGTNYLAPALLSLLLMPSLKRAGTPAVPARVVFVCSKLHEFCAGLDLADLAFERRLYGAFSFLLHLTVCS
jgi:hypothetical protein